MATATNEPHPFQILDVLHQTFDFLEDSSSVQAAFVDRRFHGASLPLVLLNELSPLTWAIPKLALGRVRLHLNDMDGKAFDGSCRSLRDACLPG